MLLSVCTEVCIIMLLVCALMDSFDIIITVCILIFVHMRVHIFLNVTIIPNLLSLCLSLSLLLSFSLSLSLSCSLYLSLSFSLSLFLSLALFVSISLSLFLSLSQQLNHGLDVSAMSNVMSRMKNVSSLDLSNTGKYYSRLLWRTCIFNWVPLNFHSLQPMLKSLTKSVFFKLFSLINFLYRLFILI